MVLSDFGTAQKVTDARWLLDVHPLHPPSGNQAHRAPEVWAAVQALSGGEDVGRVPVEKQAAWACGVLLFEVAVNDHPFGDYPNHGVLAEDLPQPDWGEVRRCVSERFVRVVQGLLQCEPAARSSVADALLALQ